MSEHSKVIIGFTWMHRKDHGMCSRCIEFGWTWYFISCGKFKIEWINCFVKCSLIDVMNHCFELPLVWKDVVSSGLPFVKRGCLCKVSVSIDWSFIYLVIILVCDGQTCMLGKVHNCMGQCLIMKQIKWKYCLPSCETNVLSLWPIQWGILCRVCKVIRFVVV